MKNTIMEYSNANFSESGLRTHGAFVTPHGAFVTPHGAFNPYHGKVKNWFRKVGRKIKGWFHKGKKFYNDHKETIQNVYNTATDIIPGGGKIKELVETGKDIYSKYSPIVKKGYEVAKEFTHGSRQRSATRFRVKAMRKLGPQGYRTYQGKIERYANKPYAHKLLIKDLRRRWATQNGGGTLPGHGVSSKYMPGSHIKRFRFATKPKFSPGWKGHVNNRPMRLMPFGRTYTSIPTPNGSMNTKHGLCSPYHGLRSWLGGIAKKAYQKFVPGSVQKVIEPFKEPLKQLYETGKRKISGKLAEKIGSDKVQQFQSLYRTGKKLVRDTGLGRAASRAISGIHTEHGRRRFKTWAAYSIHPSVYQRMPHGKKMNKFYAKYYGRKHINRALNLERQMWAMGKKRDHDGMY